MANITNYIRWMGSLSFAQMGFSEFDAIALSIFTYLDIDGFVKESEDVTLEEVIRRIEDKKHVIFFALDWRMKKHAYAAFLKAFFTAPRYKNIRLSRFVDKIEEDGHLQFAAMTFALDDGSQLVSFRGTDDSLAGWKEDFMFSFTRVPAQELALEYLKNALADGKKTYVAGHSKGGCLAEYATLFLNGEERSHVAHAYFLDSPGLCEDVFPNADIHFIDGIVTAIEPEYDIVAAIFDHEWSDKRIIASDEKGIMQHGMLSWIIDEGHFIPRRKNDPSSTWTSNVIMSWLGGVSQKEREGFVDDLFHALSKHGEKSLWDLGKNPARAIDSIFVSYFGASKKRKKTVSKLGLFLVFGTNIRAFGKKRKYSILDLAFTSLFQGIFMAVMGVMFLVVPPSAKPYFAAIMLSLAVVMIAVATIVTLAKDKWNFYAHRMRIALLLLVILLYASLWVEINYLISFSNTIFGILFIAFGMWLSENIEYSRLKSKFDLVWNILEIILYALTGAYFIFAPDSLLAIGYYTVGIVLLCDAGYRVIR